MIQARYSVIEDDVAAFGAYQAEHSPVYRRSRLSTTFLVIAIFVLLGFAVASRQTTTSQSVGAFLFAAAIGAAAGWDFWRRYPRYLARRVRRIYSAESAPSALGEHTLMIDSDGIVVANEHTRSELAWSSIVSLGETSAHIFVFIGPLQAIVIPRASVRGTSPDSVLEALRPHVRAAA